MRVAIVAGEASGDLHAANLLAALRTIEPSVEAFGVGGERLRGAGLECLARSEELSVMGLAEVVRHLPRLLGIARRVRRSTLARRPDVAVLVDSPDFNLPLARHLNEAGIPVIVYVSPQLWAWRSGRVRRIRRDVAKVLCILPFETEFYGRHGVDAEYVGHPLVDELSGVVASPPPREAGALALLPGSRWHEVASLLPTMLEAAAGLRAEGVTRFRLIAAPGLDAARLAAMAATAKVEVELVTSDRHRALASCQAALVASGTATLECALLGVPMVVGYRLHPLSYLLAKALVDVPHVALVNLVAGRRIAFEAVQGEYGRARLVAEVRSLFGEAGERQREELAEVRRRLGRPGASLRAAEVVAKMAGRR